MLRFTAENKGTDTLFLSSLTLDEFPWAIHQLIQRILWQDYIIVYQNNTPSKVV